MKIIHYTRSANLTYAVAICPARGHNWRSQQEVRVVRFYSLGIANPLDLTAIPNECEPTVLKHSAMPMAGHPLNTRLRQAALENAIKHCNTLAAEQCLKDVQRGIAFPHTDRSQRYAILGERHVNG